MFNSHWRGGTVFSGKWWWAILVFISLKCNSSFRITFTWGLQFKVNWHKIWCGGLEQGLHASNSLLWSHLSLCGIGCLTGRLLTTAAPGMALWVSLLSGNWGGSKLHKFQNYTVFCHRSFPTDTVLCALLCTFCLVYLNQY